MWLPYFLVKLHLFTPELTVNHPDQHTAGVSWSRSCKQPQPYVMAWVLCKSCHPDGSKIDGCRDQHSASLGCRCMWKCLLFPDPQLAQRGSPATSEPWDALQEWSSPHGCRNSRHHQALTRKDLPIVTRRLLPTIRVV